MICNRCQRVIMPDELYNEHVHDRPTSPPLVLHSHQGPCPTSKTPEAGATTADLGKGGRRRRAT